LFGTIDSFLCHWLSGASLHITDITNASRTLLMDIKNGEWSDECLDFFSVPKACLPTIVKNIGPYGKTKGLNFLPDGIPIAAMAGDQQAALFGQICLEKGDAKATYGTGCFILLNTGRDLVFSNHGLLTSVAYQLNDEHIYCMEGAAFIAGAAIQFLRDNLGLIKSSPDVEALAKTEIDSRGVVFIPALSGLGAPYWKPDARGMLAGLDRGTSKGHIARAVLEGIALQNTDILTAMEKDGVKPLSLKVDGGAAKNDLLMQIQADLLGVPCIRPESSQKTGLGAAYLALIALGVVDSVDAIKNFSEKAKQFSPHPERSWADALIAHYHRMLQCA
jgi:glycerol kinase